MSSRPTSGSRPEESATGAENRTRSGDRSRTNDDEGARVKPYGDDLYTEPDSDADTLANLGPLRRLAGVWSRTLSYRMDVTAPDDGSWSYQDGSWSYQQVGVLAIPGRAEPFRHVDRNTLARLAPPTPNPRARRSDLDGALPIGNLHEESGTLR